MFAPGLGKGFQFNVSRLAPLLAEIVLNRPHLFERQIELAFAAEAFESVVVERRQWNFDAAKVVLGADVEPVDL